MLQTQPQWLLALLFLLFGFICGIIIGAIYGICILFGNKKFLKIITDILKCLTATFTYILLINSYNWGEHRLYLITTFLIGIFAERKTLGKLFAKLYNKLYNFIVKKLKQISNSKIGVFLKR